MKISADKFNWNDPKCLELLKYIWESTEDPKREQ